MRLPHNDRDAALAPQRVDAEGRLAVASRGGQTRLLRLGQEGAAKIRMPRVPEGDPLEAVLINTAGGLTGGDRLAWAVDLAADARAVVTTPGLRKDLPQRRRPGRGVEPAASRAGGSPGLAAAGDDRVRWCPARPRGWMSSLPKAPRCWSSKQWCSAGPQWANRWSRPRSATAGGSAEMAGSSTRRIFDRPGRAGDAGAPAVAARRRDAVACLLVVADQAPQAGRPCGRSSATSGGAQRLDRRPDWQASCESDSQGQLRLRQRLVPLLELLNGEAGAAQSLVTLNCGGGR